MKKFQKQFKERASWTRERHTEQHKKRHSQCCSSENGEMETWQYVQSFGYLWVLSLSFVRYANLRWFRRNGLILGRPADSEKEGWDEKFDVDKHGGGMIIALKA